MVTKSTKIYTKSTKLVVGLTVFTLSSLNFSKDLSNLDRRPTLAEATYQPVDDPTKVLADYAALQKSSDIKLHECILVVYREKDSLQTGLLHCDHFEEVYKRDLVSMDIHLVMT